MKLEIVQKLKALKPGKHFFVRGQKERKQALQAAQLLKMAGHIDFDVVTKAADGDNFKVAAI